MNRPTAALLLSALVFPGAGQLYLKRYLRGIILVVLSLTCLWIIADRVLQQASSVLAQLASEGGAVDAGRLTDLVAQTSSGSDGLAVTTATLALAGCWVIGVVDAWRIARSQQETNTDICHPPTQ